MRERESWQPSDLERESLVLGELDEENRSWVVACEGCGLGEQAARAEGAHQITHTLPLHTDIRSEDIVPHLVRSEVTVERERQGRSPPG